MMAKCEKCGAEFDEAHADATLRGAVLWHDPRFCRDILAAQLAEVTRERDELDRRLLSYLEQKVDPFVTRAEEAEAQLAERDAEVGRLSTFVHDLSYGEVGDSQAFDWPEFWASVKRRAQEALAPAARGASEKTCHDCGHPLHEDRKRCGALFGTEQEGHLCRCDGEWKHEKTSEVCALCGKAIPDLTQSATICLSCDERPSRAEPSAFDARDIANRFCQSSPIPTAGAVELLLKLVYSAGRFSERADVERDLAKMRLDPMFSDEQRTMFSALAARYRDAAHLRGDAVVVMGRQDASGDHARKPEGPR
jgi:hypothetical protein